MNGKPARHNKINPAARVEQADAAAILDAENGLIRLADVLEELPEGHLSEEAARYILSVVRQNCEKIRYTEVTDQVVANYNILDILDGLPTIEDEVKMLMSDLLAMFNQVEAAQEMLDEAKACRADHPSDTDLDLDEMIRRRRLRLAVRTEIVLGDLMKGLRLYKALPQDVRSEEPSLTRFLAEEFAAKGFSLEAMRQNPKRLYEASFNAFETYFRLGGRSATAYECLGVLYAKTGHRDEGIECLDAGMQASLENRDVKHAVNFSLAFMQLEFSDIFDQEPGKTFSTEGSAYERCSWMVRQFARGREGRKAILLATLAVPMESLTMFERNLVARSAVELKDVPRALAIADAMGSDDDGNVMRLLLLAKCAAAQHDCKKARDLAVKAFAFIVTNDVAQESVDVAFMRIFEHLSRWMTETGDMEPILEFIDTIPKEWTQQSRLMRLLAGASIARCPKGEASDIYEATLSVLEPVPKRDRESQWYVALGHAHMQVEQYDKAISNYETAKKKIRKLDAREAGAFSKRLVAEMQAKMIETIETNIACAREHIAVRDKIPAVEERLRTLLEEAGFKIVRFINNGDGPVIAVCAHAVDGHIARLIVADEKTLMKAESAQTDGAAPMLQQVCSIAVEAEEAKSINRNDWRVQTLDVVGRKIRSIDDRVNTGFGVKLTKAGIGTSTIFPGFVLVEPWDAAGSSITKVDMYEVVPLCEDEFEFVSFYTLDMLLERLHGINFWPMKADRENACLSNDWRPLIPGDQIREIVKGAAGAMYGRVSREVLQRGAEIAAFYREEPNQGFSGWVFLAAGRSADRPESLVGMATVELNTIANYAPFVADYLDSEPGSAFIHEGSGNVKRTDMGAIKFGTLSDEGGHRLS